MIGFDCQVNRSFKPENFFITPMKTRITSIALLVLAGLFTSTSRTNAAIVELNVNDTSIYNSYYDDGYDRNIELQFRFINGAFVTNLNYWDAINIKSQYYYYSSATNIFISGESEAWAYASGTAAVAVSAGDTIYHTTSGWTEHVGYSYMHEYYPEYSSDYTDQNNYGLGVSANAQYIGLYDNGYFGYASVTIPEADGRMYINKVAFNDVSGQGIIAGGGAIPEPSTYGLIGIGALGVAFAARRRKLKKTA